MKIWPLEWVLSLSLSLSLSYLSQFFFLGKVLPFGALFFKKIIFCPLFAFLPQKIWQKSINFFRKNCHVSTHCSSKCDQLQHVILKQVQPLLVTDSEKCSLPSDFFWWIFSILQKVFWKKNILSQIPFLETKEIVKKIFFIKNFTKNRHNCLQYERMLKIFYFHSLHITKFS